MEVSDYFDDSQVIAWATKKLREEYPDLGPFDVGEHEHDGITERYCQLLDGYAHQKWRAEEGQKPYVATIRLEVQIRQGDDDVRTTLRHLEKKLAHCSFWDYLITSVGVTK